MPFSWFTGYDLIRYGFEADIALAHVWLQGQRASFFDKGLDCCPYCLELGFVHPEC